MTWFSRVFFFGFALVAMQAQADPLRPAPYSELATRLGGRITFDTLPNRPEPGFALDHPVTVQDARMGAGFAGQVRAQRRFRDGTTHDDISRARATAPLTVLGDGPGRGLAFAYHRGFGSVAVFPLGPDGFSRLSGRGEGALAVLFAADQSALGLRIHSDYPDPLGVRATRPGMAEIIALARDGRVIGRHSARLKQGITEIGLTRASGATDIAGFLLLNTDPGGIAVDDILVQRAPLLGEVLTGPRAARRLVPGQGTRTR